MDERLEKIIEQVHKPGRYIGGEWNAVRKDWNGPFVKALLCFPDVYEVGMSYLGLKILYGLLNEREDVLCERVFAPWPDMEAVLRRENYSLFSLESKAPIRGFDIIGFSLAYELTYTNVVNVLDLGGIPKRSRDRGKLDPLIIAGGPSCYNPEPVADFFDAVVIGEGEEVIGEIIDCYKQSRSDCLSTVSGGVGSVSRPSLLRRLADIKGVYVPSLYTAAYHDDGTLKGFYPRDGAPAGIQKRIVEDLNTAYYPTKQVVPYIQVVHDRIAMEIMRGCKNFCKFCQAGSTYRPKRERTKDKIVELAGAAFEHTGYEEMSLISLSSGDHSQAAEIIASLNEAYSGKGISLSFPSLRIEGAIDTFPALIAAMKKTGFTFAPESGSRRLRGYLNKNIKIETLLAAALEAYKTGWKRIKLYFMIGLPTESEEDLTEIINLIEAVSAERKKVNGKPAFVTASVSSFIPKAHTPFQREAMAKKEDLKKKKSFLIMTLRKRKLSAKLDFHDFEKGFLEGVFSRGDRRLSAVIEGAWKRGARFDSWREFFKEEYWTQAFDETGIDPEFYVYRKRDTRELFPWDFVNVGLKKDFS